MLCTYPILSSVECRECLVCLNPSIFHIDPAHDIPVLVRRFSRPEVIPDTHKLALMEGFGDYSIFGTPYPRIDSLGHNGINRLGCFLRRAGKPFAMNGYVSQYRASTHAYE